MMRKLGAFLPLIALVCLVALGAFMLLRGGERETISEGLVGQSAPSFALMRIEGEGMVTSDEFAGRPHLINLFASWCTPCRAEHSQLMALEAHGVAILGISYKDRPEATRGFLNELGDPFEAVGQDPDGRLGLELGVTGVPETFVIGADGRVRAVHRGPLTPDVVREEILPALAN